MDRVFIAGLEAALGTEKHALAAMCIRLGQKLPDTQQTMSLYVNDCIGFQMVAEQPLYYSDNAFGTPDAMSYRNKVLRISDLKTGKTLTSVHQLEVYAAFFCLEYEFSPFELEIELRIYQSDECRLYIADPVDILRIMDRTKMFSARIDEMRKEMVL